MPISPLSTDLVPYANSRMPGALERLAIIACLIALFGAGYFSVGLLAMSQTPYVLALPIDRHIPFVEQSVWVYLALFPATLAPAFFSDSHRLFWRAALAYGFAIVASLFLFMAYPGTSTELRAACPAGIDSQASCWAVSTLYSLDPPHNLFPSLHISIAVLAAYATWKAVNRWGLTLGLGVVSQCVAVCTVKQHFVIDVMGGLAVGALAILLFLRPCRAAASANPVRVRRAATAFLLFAALFYAAIYASYLAARH